MTLAIAIRITGDASSLKSEASSAVAAVRVVGAAADEAAQQVQRLTREQTAAARSMDAYGLSAIKTSEQLKAQAAAVAQGAAQEAVAIQRLRDTLDPCR